MRLTLLGVANLNTQTEDMFTSLCYRVDPIRWKQSQKNQWKKVKIHVAISPGIQCQCNVVMETYLYADAPTNLHVIFYLTI